MKKINQKCMDCSTLDIRNMEEKPACYQIRTCARMRSYYRNHDEKKLKMRLNFFKYKNMGTQCALCCSRIRLEVHHIEPRLGREDRDDLNNMITLCHDCHAVVEAYTKRVRYFYTLQESLALGKNVTVNDNPIGVGVLPIVSKVSS